jgi:hypothetical protein
VVSYGEFIKGFGLASILSSIGVIFVYYLFGSVLAILLIL